MYEWKPEKDNVIEMHDELYHSFINELTGIW